MACSQTNPDIRADVSQTRRTLRAKRRSRPLQQELGYNKQILGLSSCQLVDMLDIAAGERHEARTAQHGADFPSRSLSSFRVRSVVLLKPSWCLPKPSTDGRANLNPIVKFELRSHLFAARVRNYRETTEKGACERVIGSQALFRLCLPNVCTGLRGQPVECRV